MNWRMWQGVAAQAQQIIKLRYTPFSKKDRLFALALRGSCHQGLINQSSEWAQLSIPMLGEWLGEHQNT